MVLVPCSGSNFAVLGSRGGRLEAALTLSSDVPSRLNGRTHTAMAKAPARPGGSDQSSVLHPMGAITNADLIEKDIPGPDADWFDRWGILVFASTFNGYKYWGSSKKCFEVGFRARTEPLEGLSLTELRTALFCQYRSIAHTGEFHDTDRPDAQALLRQIRDRVARGAID